MTASREPDGKAVPQPVTLDAVASHLRRRAAYADDEALVLSMTVRDLNTALQAALCENEALKARIAELEASNG